MQENNFQSFHSRRCWISAFAGFILWLYVAQIHKSFLYKNNKYAALLRPHSIILACCKPGCKPGFRPGLQPGFRQVRAGLRHAFDMLSTRFRLFLSKIWSRTCCINLDMSRLMQQVRWFARVLDKWNVAKPFRASQRTCWSWIFVTYFIIRAYHDVIKWKKRYEKAWFYTQKRYKCVDNGTQNSPTSILKLLHVSTRIIGFHFWKHSAMRIISVSVSDILFNPCGMFLFFFRLGRYHCGT